MDPAARQIFKCLVVMMVSAYVVIVSGIALFLLSVLMERFQHHPEVPAWLSQFF